jgi:ribosomal protein L40E
MGLLKQLMGKYLSGGHGNKHGRSGKHGDRYGYSQPTYNKHENPIINNIPSKTCSSCNASNLNDAKFCQQCGTSLSSSDCSQCQTKLSPDAKFCPQCGKIRA